MRNITEGDTVNINYNGGYTMFRVIVLHVPQDVGDMWYFDNHGTIFAQNPLSSNLDTISKVKNPEKIGDPA